MTKGQFAHPAESTIAAQYHHYPLSSNIVIQLLLQDFLSVYYEISVLRDLLPKIAPTSSTTPSRKTSVATRKKLERSLTILLPESDDRLLDHPWNSPRGVLSKLRYHVLMLAEAAVERTETTELLTLVSKARQFARAASTSLQPPDVMKLVRAMERSSQLLPPILKNFAHEENVLFFLARHHRDFDDLLGNGYTYTLLSSLQTKGLSGVRSLLLKRYRQRGFTELLSQIGELMDEIAMGAS